MPVTTTKQTLSINQVIGEKNDTIIAEEDFVVPDIKPDILNIIQTSGTVCVYKKDVGDSNVKIEGNVNTYVMYVSDGENSSVRGLNVSLDFSKTVDFEKLKNGMAIENKVTLKTIECRVLNGRKIRVKAILDVEIKAFSNQDVEFIKEIENVKDIQMLNMSTPLTSMLGAGITKVYAKDTLVIDNQDDLQEILSAQVFVINQETKVSYNKVLVKADTCVKIMYLTEDNRICTCSNLIPIMGFIDMPDVTEENLCDVGFELKNIIIKPNNVEEHSIYVEAEIEINCNVSQSKEMNIIQDLYSPSVNLIYKQKQIQVISKKRIITDIFNLREKQVISEIGSHKIYDAIVTPSIVNKTVLKDHILYEGQVEINFIFASDNTEGISTKNIVIPFNYNMNVDGAKTTSNIETNLSVIMQDFTVMPDESIDMKIDLEFTTSISNSQNLQVIEEINVDETRQNERYSLNIYFVKQGDTLWKIAKKFRTSMEEISKMNEIEDVDKLNIGQQLFIPNYSMKM